MTAVFILFGYILGTMGVMAFVLWRSFAQPSYLDFQAGRLERKERSEPHQDARSGKRE